MQQLVHSPWLTRIFSAQVMSLTHAINNISVQLKIITAVKAAGGTTDNSVKVILLRLLFWLLSHVSNAVGTCSLFRPNWSSVPRVWRLTSSTCATPWRSPPSAFEQQPELNHASRIRVTSSLPCIDKNGFSSITPLEEEPLVVPARPEHDEVGVVKALNVHVVGAEAAPDPETGNTSFELACLLSLGDHFTATLPLAE
jgi:hypothetical protein